MAYERKIIMALQNVVNLPKNSRFLYADTRDLLLLAFEEPKPLFSTADKPKAEMLMVESLPLFESCFANLHGSLNRDLRQIAQQCVSGLQFLVDEFLDQDQVYHKIQPIMVSAPVTCVKRFIKHTKGTNGEYTIIDPQDLTGIPASHFWWSENSKKRKKNEMNQCQTGQVEMPPAMA